jgi:hypothetical protein
MNMAGELLAKDKTEKATMRWQTNTLFRKNLLPKIISIPPFPRITYSFFLPDFFPPVKVDMGGVP